MVVSCVCAVLIVIILYGFIINFVQGTDNITFNSDLPINRTFTIDHEANTFLMNGEPFRYVSGSFHYFSAMPDNWHQIIKTIKSVGLNVLDTYVEWSLHNPKDGVYDWTTIADVEKFIALAQQEGFYVILRPGPYICAERDNGGVPFWLFRKYPEIKLRTSDANYINEVATWYSKLMPRMQRFLYGNGGPIIMVQVENEYGAFSACDRDYLNWLRDETLKYVGDKALLFTTDMPTESIKCGKIEGVFATINFGAHQIHEIESVWNTLRSVQPTGPLVNSKFYPGSLIQCLKKNQRHGVQLVADALKRMFSYEANVNFCMFLEDCNFCSISAASNISLFNYDAIVGKSGEGAKHFEWVRNIFAQFFELITSFLRPKVTTIKPDLATYRKFTIDQKTNDFLMDGKPFRYVSGSFHYFRAVPEAWQKRMRTMKAAGLNALDTYVEWSLHNPHDGFYDWSGIADVEKFIELAQQEGLYVILRPGPYICAERDNGGVPFWLFRKYPDIKLRTSDANYINEVALWYSILMSRMQRFLYGNGGPIIMVQVENEYGAFSACDRDYLNWLRDETLKYVGDKALLFTTDIPDKRIKCGKIEGVFATTDFGIDRVHEIKNIWDILRSVQPTGPLVNSEFYPGWLTHWQEQNQRRDGQLVADALKEILSFNASVNFYMFFGGTNIGFTAGANDFGDHKYVPDITSYDYDAVMDEPGNITKKFELVREVIAQYFEIPKVEIRKEQTFAYGKVEMRPIMQLLSDEGRITLGNGMAQASVKPKTFEELDQFSGLVLYETNIEGLNIESALLTVNDLRDRALVYVDQEFMGILSRQNGQLSLTLHKSSGSKLQILVENQGRINFNVANDSKGIKGEVTLLKSDGGEEIKLNNWLNTGYPLEEPHASNLLKMLRKKYVSLGYASDETSKLTHGPTVYYGEFVVNDFHHTFLNPTGWGKGVAFLNGFNLGRYWPIAGPQLTLYIPQEVLHPGINSLLIIEYEQTNRVVKELNPYVTLDDKPQLDT